MGNYSYNEINEGDMVRIYLEAEALVSGYDRVKKFEIRRIGVPEIDDRLQDVNTETWKSFGEPNEEGFYSHDYAVKVPLSITLEATIEGLPHRYDNEYPAEFRIHNVKDIQINDREYAYSFGRGDIERLKEGIKRCMTRILAWYCFSQTCEFVNSSTSTSQPKPTDVSWIRGGQEEGEDNDPYSSMTESRLKRIVSESLRKVLCIK